MRPLEPHEHEVYDLPTVSKETATLYEHCLRALRRACTVGAHGLPLIGVGDWNDGMNRVGIEGRGESVWLAWFLNDTLRAFADQCDTRADGVSAGELRTTAELYAKAANEQAWDGAWYRRAYFDDGTPLGSAQNDECRIDSIAQSWSVISDAGEPDKQSSCCSRRRSTRPPTIPVISRDTCRAFGRTERSTRMPRCGPFSRRRSAITAIGRSSSTR
jgi:cyclic beta-1,2-glucan synthetase